MRELGSRGGSRGWNQEHSGKDLLSKEIGCFFPLPAERDKYIYGNKDRLMRSD